MIGVFVDPGVFPDVRDPGKRKNRNAEYDAFDDRYATFLLEDYGDLGIEVKRNPTDPTIFMSWGGVLYIQGPPAEVRKQIDLENAKQARGNGGT